MTAGFDPATASQACGTRRSTRPASVKVTSTMSSRMLVEGGFSTNYERYNIMAQHGITKERGTPEWYTQINKQRHRSLGTNWNARYGGENYGQYPGSVRVRRVRLVRHRRPQHQGGHAGHVGQLSPHAAAPTATSGRSS